MRDAVLLNQTCQLTKDERHSVHRLDLVGDTVRGVQEQVFKGCPQIWLMDGDHGSMISRREITWRAVGSNAWTVGTDRPPLGRVEFALNRRGELLAWTRAEIVPAGFSIEPNIKLRSLRLSGLEGASVSAAGPRPLTPKLARRIATHGCPRSEPRGRRSPRLRRGAH